MVRKSYAAFLLGAVALAQATQAHGDSGQWAANIILAQAPEQAPQPATPAPAQPQPAAPSEAAPQTPPPPSGQAPAATPEGAPPVQLPPVKIVTPPAPRPKLPRKIAPQRAAPRVAAPVSPAPAPATEAAPAEAAAATAEQGVAMTPVKGSEIPLDKVPGAVSQVSSGEIQTGGTPATALQGAIQQYVPGAVISDVTGNPFMTDIQYRGFSSSPVEGTPQGLAVYQNGVRINEVFGDTVNWDLIPANAINGITLVSGNPLYGLNALGGALNIVMKDGFGFQGVESDTRAGSFGWFQESLQMGKQVDNFAAYLAVEGIWQNGWRQFSPSEVRRMYADLGAKDKNTEFHINFTGANNALGQVGPSPVQLLAEDYSAVFTNPQTVDNQLAMVSANGSTKLTDTWSLSGVAYLRSFHQHRVDANFSNVAPCPQLGDSKSADAGLLCLPTDSGPVPVTDQFGNKVPTASLYGLNDTIGEIDRSSNNTNSYGTSLQATDKDKIFGLNNIFIGGASVDHGDAKTTSVAELGTVNTQNLVIAGNGVFLSNPLDIAPVDLKTTTNYYGIFFTDTLDLTNALSVTAGGRYNYQEILLQDQLNLPGSHLSGDHIYQRFNPMAGATYKFNENLSAYGGYGEATRAPTPAELACADPNQPCLLANFLVSDPNLKQVVSETSQAGFRGNFSPFGYGRLDWSAGVFRTVNFDDILTVTSPLIPTRGFFENAGKTQREGVEANLTYKWERLAFNANFAYVDAIFLNNLTLSSPNNPAHDVNGNIIVHPGDHIPTIPPYRLKTSFDYNLTDAWKVGTDIVLASSQYFHGDESNQNPQLPGYGVVNLRTSYEIEKGVTIYGIITNLFDHKYATYGAFYDTEIRNVSGQLSTNLTNPDMITPAQPFSVYGGLRIKF